MISKTYTHPGVNAVMLAMSQALRKAVLYRRDANGFTDLDSLAGPPASPEVCQLYADAYEAQAHELGVKLATIAPPRNVYIADEERRELELLSLRRSLVIGFFVFALGIVSLCAVALWKS